MVITCLTAADPVSRIAYLQPQLLQVKYSINEPKIPDFDIYNHLSQRLARFSGVLQCNASICM